MMGTHRRMLHKARWGIAVGGWLLGSLAWAQSAIESVSGSIQGGTEVVRIELSEALAADPTGFAIQSPARIALDFPGTTNGTGKSVVELNQGNLRSINISSRLQAAHAWC